jgi:hypothetical protein
LYAPLVPSAKHGRYLPLPIVYKDVCDIIDTISQTHPDYKRKVMGEDLILEAHPKYWEINMLLEKNIPLPDWQNPDKYSVRTKAQIRAVFILKGMYEVVEAHYREQREERERSAKDDGRKTLGG